MNDALDTMGTIHDEPVGSRDAVHVAVLSVTAGNLLRPGQHVALDDDGSTARSNGLGAPTVGIVDPFLDVPVLQPGEKFWLFVYPRTITGLQHVWTHPQIPEQLDPASIAGDGITMNDMEVAVVTRGASETWLREYLAEYAGTGNPYDDPDCDTFESLVEKLSSAYDDYVIVRGYDASGPISPQLWPHLENYLGHPVAHHPTYWSCSC